MNRPTTSGTDRDGPRNPSSTVAFAGPARVVICEPTGGGHRFEYVTQVWRALAAEHVDVELVTTAAAAAKDDFTLRFDDQSVVVHRQAKRSIRQVLAVCRRDPMILLDADRLIGWVFAALVLRRSSALVYCLLIRPPNRHNVPRHVRIRARAKFGAWSLLARSSRVDVLLLGDSFGELSDYARVPARMTVVADRPESKSEAASIDGTAQPAANRHYLLLAGSVGERKAAIETIDAVRRVPGLDLHIVGSVAPLVLSHLRSLDDEARARITVVDEYVDDAQLDDAVRGAWAVSVVLNTQIGSSGLLGRSVLYGVPVVAGGNVTVCHTVTTRRLGAVAAANTAEGIAVALFDLQDNYDRYRSSVATQREELLRSPTVGEAVRRRVLVGLVRAGARSSTGRRS